MEAPPSCKRTKDSHLCLVPTVRRVTRLHEAACMWPLFLSLARAVIYEDLETSTPPLKLLQILKDLESCKVLQMLDGCVRGGLDPFIRYLIGSESRGNLRRDRRNRSPG